MAYKEHFAFRKPLIYFKSFWFLFKIKNQLQTHKSSIKTQRKHKMAPNHSHLSHSNYRQNKTKEMLKSFAHVNDTVKLEKSDTNEQYFQRISFLFFMLQNLKKMVLNTHQTKLNDAKYRPCKGNKQCWTFCSSYINSLKCVTM